MFRSTEEDSPDFIVVVGDLLTQVYAYWQAVGYRHAAQYGPETPVASFAREVISNTRLIASAFEIPAQYTYFPAVADPTVVVEEIRSEELTSQSEAIQLVREILETEGADTDDARHLALDFFSKTLAAIEEFPLVGRQNQEVH